MSDETYLAMTRLRFISGGKLCTVEPKQIFSFDGDEGVDIGLLLRTKAIIKTPAIVQEKAVKRGKNSR
uniref:Uncharacterized protein n=1 Tax=viral metagenome TaxID=1070528 RepID=A0A6M3LDY0_9ZZZZ